jgi:hypothetical protein
MKYSLSAQGVRGQKAEPIVALGTAGKSEIDLSEVSLAPFGVLIARVH